MRKVVLRAATVVGVLTAAMWLTVGSASAAAPPPPPQPIGPNQFFAASINGTSPVVGPPTLAVVKVICPGPAALGRRGHPLGGQPVLVSRATPRSIRRGFTGRAGTSVVATFANDRTVPLTFTQYGVAQPIPVKLLLPCSGAGTVGFVPAPFSPGAVGIWIGVRFVNIAS